MTSPFELYQYFRNVDDKDVIKCLKFLTFLPLNEIRDMEYLSGEDINEAKKTLAYEVTKLVHNKTTAKSILQSSEQMFSGKAESSDMPTTEVDSNKKISIIELLIETKLIPSKSEGRRIIQGGGIYLNDNRVDDSNMMIDPIDYSTREIIIRKGKKSFHRVRFLAA